MTTAIAFTIWVLSVIGALCLVRGGSRKPTTKEKDK